MAKGSSKGAPKGGSKTDPPNPKGQRVLVMKNGRKLRLEWRPRA